MKNTHTDTSDIIVIGAGMGGMTIACLLANENYNVTVLEAAHVAGGCSSSYKRKGYTFESGATTLIGFDPPQPLFRLEKMLGIEIPRVEITPSMMVHVDGETCVRFKDKEQWINEAARVFGNPKGQRRFWQICFDISDMVWEASARNPFFPPRKFSDWVRLAFNNPPTDALKLKYAFQSVGDVMKSCEVDTVRFRRFVDEQLMITAQATCEAVPFLFGAAGLTYTNYSNFYVDGGLLRMIETMERFLSDKGGRLLTRSLVNKIEKTGTDFHVYTANGKHYTSKMVFSNIPIWNMEGITEGEIAAYFRKESLRYNEAWGAFTMGIVTGDAYAAYLPLHHQVHLPEEMPHIGAESFFVSMSRRGDTLRAPEGTRTLNISCHTPTTDWFNLGETYEIIKKEVEDFILSSLDRQFPGFRESGLKLHFGATPVTWQNWVHRFQGRVGGIPQKMSRSLLDWSPAETPFEGLYLCGDTVYPGQGIPGVTLSGINVYYRSKKTRRKLIKK